MSKKKTHKHISGDPRKNSKPMNYKGFSRNRIVEDTMYILPRIYNTEFSWVKKFGKDKEFGTMENFVKKCFDDVDFYSFQIRLFFGAFLTSPCLEMNDVFIGDDGYISSFGFFTENTDKYNSIMEIFSSVMKMEMTQIYDVLTNRTDLKVGVR